MKEKIIEYAKLLTIHQWGVACLTAVYGALSAGELNVIPLFLLAIIGVQATLFSAVFNDYIDVETDKLSKDLHDRPLVKGSIPRIHALYITIIAVIIAYSITLIAMYLDIFVTSIIPLIVLSSALLFGSIYNIYGKKFAGSDIFSAGGAAFFCLYGATVVSEKITYLTAIVVSLAFLQIFFLTAIIGGIKDADHDYKMNIKNIAYRFGVRVKKDFIIPISFKIFSLLFRTSSAILLLIPFIHLKNYPFYIWQPIILILMYIGIFYGTIKMLNLKKFDREQIRKLISLQAFLRYSAVPIMLFKFIGLSISLFLIIVPFVWFVIFNRLLYGSLIRPKRM